MDFNPIYQTKNKFLWQDAFFYIALACFLVAIFAYGIFAFKITLQKQNIEELQSKLDTYGSSMQKADEQTVLSYKKKVDDFTVLIKNHRISLNVFNFIEDHTLPTVWFSTVDMSESSEQLKLSGQTETMETLSRQVQAFEKSVDYIHQVTVLQSRVDSIGKVTFVLSLSLDPTIFEYQTPLVAASQSINASNTATP